MWHVSARPLPYKFWVWLFSLLTKTASCFNFGFSFACLFTLRCFVLFVCLFVYLAGVFAYQFTQIIPYFGFYISCNCRQLKWWEIESDISSVITQKGESQNGCFKKTKHVKLSKKRTFFKPWYAHVNIRTHTYQGVKVTKFE